MLALVHSDPPVVALSAAPVHDDATPVHAEPEDSACRLCHCGPKKWLAWRARRVYDPAGGVLCSACMDQVFEALAAELVGQADDEQRELLEAFVGSTKEAA